MASASLAAAVRVAARDDPSPFPQPPRTATQRPCLNVLGGLQCTPSRRSLKFSASWHARQFLAFDTAISRDERLFLFMELFVFRQQLVDRRVLPDFQLATYAPEELLEVRVITDPRHPAYGQAGLFAKSTIPSNTIVTPYSGFIEVFATSCNSRTYTMGFGAVGDDYALDAEFVGNYGRFANDPRGVGTLQANLSAENRFNNRGESFTALVSRRQINPGEEILMSYGKAHRLSATPWMNVQGEPIMRPRLGGVVPFPSFRTESVSAASDSTSAPPALATSLPQRSADSAKAEGSCAAEGPGVAAGSASATGSSASVSEADGSSAPAVDRAGITWSAPNTKQPLARPRCLPDVANDLLWECTQCGMWSICEASTADAPLRCAACATPKLSGARLVSLLSSPAITQATLLAEAGLDSQGPSAASTSTPPQTQVSAAPLTSSTNFSSEHTDWPMNVPFLPWQVWDAAVPLTVLAKHSRFETQRHIFVYTVDTGLGREKRGRSVLDANGSGPTVAAPMPPGAPDAEQSQEARPFKASRFQSQSRNADDASLAGVRVRDEHPIVTEENRTGRGRCGSAAHGSGRSKRNALWERQGDLDSEELALLTPGIAALPLLSSSVSAYSPAHALASAASPTKLPFLEWTASASGEKSTSTDEHLGVAQIGSFTAVASRDTSDSVAGILTRPPLSYLLSTTQEVDRLVVLHRAAASGPSPVAETSYSPQMTLVRRRLQCMTRRLFTGKAFQPGDVVSYVGGLVRQRGDTRCRASNSCLEIPLRFFLPPRLRRRCGGEACLARSGDSPSDAAEDAALQTFCDRLDRLSLVVTNEFMYCPCLVVEVTRVKDRAAVAMTEVSGSASDSVGYEDEVDDALESCNVALVLTLDALGSPFACAVAIKPIGAFEPLLARAQ
ncbi:SET domain family protein [Leishmania donovani]|uniref:SET domain family protein n=2 Tax=Leishmania donovani TaxID=5661 RepID=A0A504XSJ4_LEIDO|nr:SET domain family protein [Leishmania donovani]